MIIFRRLNIPLIYLSYLLSKFKLKIVFVRCLNLDNSLFKSLIKKKKIIHFSELDFQIQLSAFKFFCIQKEKFVTNAIDQIIKNYGKILKKRMSANNKELKTILFQKLMFSDELLQIYYLTKYLKEKKIFFILVGKFDYKEIILLKSNNFKIYNLIFQMIGNFYTILFYLFRFNFLRFRVFNVEKKNLKKKNFAKVLYYPHQTTQYGENSIYKKEFFYIKDKKSIFNKYNILHAEHVKKDKFLKFYKKKKLQIFFHPKTSFKKVFPLIFDLKFFFHLNQWKFINSLNASFRSYKNEFEKEIFKKIQICLIGNDYNFDNLTSFILTKRKIKTIGLQNRLVHSKWKVYSNIVDIFYAMDNYSIKNFKKNKYNLVKNYKVIGNQFVFAKKVKKNENLDFILCFDYSPSNINEQMIDVSFKNQVNFYSDIYKLSKIYDKKIFLIKSKFKNIYQDDLLFKMYKKLLSRKNIKFFHSLKNKFDFNEIYKNSKIIITKPSSIVDISLFYNKDIIVHDYERNFKILQKTSFNYGIEEMFANSFDELNSKLKKNLNKFKKNKLKKNDQFYFYKNKINYDLRKELISIEKNLS
jgi:hypothetical protein